MSCCASDLGVVTSVIAQSAVPVSGIPEDSDGQPSAAISPHALLTDVNTLHSDRVWDKLYSYTAGWEHRHNYFKGILLNASFHVKNKAGLLVMKTAEFQADNVTACMMGFHHLKPVCHYISFGPLNHRFRYRIPAPLFMYFLP